MILIIQLYYLFKLSESSHDRNPVPTLQQVVQASHHQDSHGGALPLVVGDPSLDQVRQHSTRYGHPVNMDSVREAEHAWGPWLVEIVKLGCAHADVQAIALSGWVGELAG